MSLNSFLTAKSPQLPVPHSKLTIDFKDTSRLAMDIVRVCDELFAQLAVKDPLLFKRMRQPQHRGNNNNNNHNHSSSSNIHTIIPDIQHPTTDVIVVPDERNKNNTKYIIKQIQGGITNMLYLVIDYQQVYITYPVLLRIYGENTEFFIDRAKESLLFYELGTEKHEYFGPMLLGIFGNGRMEEFYENCHSLLLHEAKYYPLIATTMQHMHSFIPSTFICSLEERGKPILWTLIDRWYDIVCQIISKEKDDDYYHSVKDTIAMVKKMSRKPSCKKLSTHSIPIQIAYEFMYESVFCHNDLLGGNVLYLQQEQCIKFVDFEYGHYNYRAFEFANHFCEYGGLECNWEEYFPSRRHIRDFLTYYIKAYVQQIKLKKDRKDSLSQLPPQQSHQPHQPHQQQQQKATFNEIEKEKKESIKYELTKQLKELYEKRSQSTANGKNWDLFIEKCVDIVLLFTCADHLLWGVWGIIQSKHSKIDFDFKSYAKLRLVHGLQFSMAKLSDDVKSFAEINHQSF